MNMSRMTSASRALSTLRSSTPVPAKEKQQPPPTCILEGCEDVVPLVKIELKIPVLILRDDAGFWPNT